MGDETFMIGTEVSTGEGMKDAHRRATIRHRHLQPTNLRLPLPTHLNHHLSKHPLLLTTTPIALIRAMLRHLPHNQRLAATLLHHNQPHHPPATILTIHRHRPRIMHNRLLLRHNHLLLHRLHTMDNTLHPLHLLPLHPTTTRLHLLLPLPTLPHLLQHNITPIHHLLLQHRLPHNPPLLQPPMAHPANPIRCLPTSTRCTALSQQPHPTQRRHSSRTMQHQPLLPRISMQQHSQTLHTDRTDQSLSLTATHSLIHSHTHPFPHSVKSMRTLQSSTQLSARHFPIQPVIARPNYPSTHLTRPPRRLHTPTLRKLCVSARFRRTVGVTSVYVCARAASIASSVDRCVVG